MHGLGTWAVAGVFIIAFNLMTNDSFRQIFHGAGTNSLNWLFVCIAWFGGWAAAFGGVNSTSGVWVASIKNVRKRDTGDFGSAA
jgi:hypothetical protein